MESTDREHGNAVTQVTSSCRCPACVRNLHRPAKISQFGKRKKAGDKGNARGRNKTPCGLCQGTERVEVTVAQRYAEALNREPGIFDMDYASEFYEVPTLLYPAKTAR